MSQLTIRRLTPTIIEGLKKRAAAAGRSMEEEARTILSDAVINQQLSHQRAWLKQIQAKRRELFGHKVFPDSSDSFHEMRKERTRHIEEWAVTKGQPKKK